MYWQVLELRCDKASGTVSTRVPGGLGYRPFMLSKTLKVRAESTAYGPRMIWSDGSHSYWIDVDRESGWPLVSSYGSKAKYLSWTRDGMEHVIEIDSTTGLPGREWTEEK
jgi:hypothetical protein